MTRTMIVFAMVALVCGANTARAETTSDTFRPGPVTIPRTEQFELRSAKGHVYRIFIAAPKGEMPAEGFAAMYVLDGNAHFGTVVDAVRFQKGLTPAVVVGIGYPTDKHLDQDRRYWDYTPVTAPEKLRSPNEPPVKPGGTGGQDDLIAFIEDVLKPEVAKRFKVDARKQALFGHSLAGRFVLYTMFTRPAAFQRYLAASPSIWWDDKSVLQAQDAFLASRASENESIPDVKLLLTVAEFEQKLPPGTSAERAAFLTKARMVDNAKEMRDRLDAAKVPVTLKEFADENHGTVVPGAISLGVRFAFSEKP